MAVIPLTTPITEAQIRTLKVGDTVEITGRLYTGRDAVHHRRGEALFPGLGDDRPAAFGERRRDGVLRELDRVSEARTRAKGATPTAPEAPRQTLMAYVPNRILHEGLKPLGTSLMNLLEETEAEMADVMDAENMEETAVAMVEEIAEGTVVENHLEIEVETVHVVQVLQIRTWILSLSISER